MLVWSSWFVPDVSGWTWTSVDVSGSGTCVLLVLFWIQANMTTYKLRNSTHFFARSSGTQGKVQICLKSLAHWVQNVCMRFFAIVSLNIRWLWNAKTTIKMLAMDAKNAENQTRSELFFDGRKFPSLCKRDWHNVRSCFFLSANISDSNFGLSVQWPEQ